MSDGHLSILPRGISFELLRWTQYNVIFFRLTEITMWPYRNIKLQHKLFQNLQAFGITSECASMRNKNMLR